MRAASGCSVGVAPSPWRLLTGPRLCWHDPRNVARGPRGWVRALTAPAGAGKGRRCTALGAWDTEGLCYKLFFEAGTQGMLLASTVGVLIDANPLACAILGYAREELRGVGLRSLVDTSRSGSRGLARPKP